MRVVLVDLLCNSPFYCAELTRGLRGIGVAAWLASPRFYLEPKVLDGCPRPRWIIDLAVHARSPRPLRLAARAAEGSLNFACLLARIQAGDFDVVHVQWIPFEQRASPFMPLLRSYCDAARTPLVVTAHNAVPHDSAGASMAALKRNLDYAHLVVAHTEHVAHELSWDVGIDVPVVEIPHGPLFTSERLPVRDEAAARLGHPAGLIVLFLGLIRPYKGLDLLLDAWREVRASVPDVALLVVGKVLDRAAAPDLERLRHEPGVQVIDRYVAVPEMLDYYAAADVVVFPYRRISQSGGLMTAAGLGRPTVVTPIAGLMEQVRNLRSARVADEVSGPGIARALVLSLQRRDEMIAEAEGDRAAIAQSPIGWESVARATARAYESGLRTLGRQPRDWHGAS